MSPYPLFVVLTSIALPLHGASSPVEPQAGAYESEGISDRAPGIEPFPDPGGTSSQRQPTAATALADAADRGCCVWKTTPPKCAYANRSYCSHKAQQANKPFEFHKDTECKKISACKK
jgi:hypothetical protein